MKCPICNLDLLLAERQGVEIDYCPKCRGIWLDRGKLDKIVEASVGARPASRDSRTREESLGYRGQRDDHHDRDGDDHDDDRGFRGRRREGLLGDLFDIG